MPRSPDEEDAPLRYRPLPSVDFAVLPHEVRAIRMQRLAIAGAAVGVIVLGLGLAYGKSGLAHLHPTRGKHHAPSDSQLAIGADAPTTTDRSAVVAEVATLAPPLRHASEAHARAVNTPALRGAPALSEVAIGEGAIARSESSFHKARSFHDALIRSGASEGEASELIGALSKLVDFRRARPEDRLIFERDAERQLQTFEYRAGVTEIYRAVRGEDGALRGLKVDIPIERRRLAKGIHVAGSLGQALRAMGLGSALSGIVTEALDSRMSFTRDVRAGDGVKIIVDEEYVDGSFLRYGSVYALEYASERTGKLQAFWYQPEHGDGDFYDNSGRALHGGWLRTPLRYDHISSPFNLKRRHPILKRIMPHLGIDYAANTATPVGAAGDGLVTFAGTRGPNGNLVSVRHNNGYESYYAHLSKIGAGIKPGVRLTQRQVLGFVGSTGRSTGPHLHFAIKRAGHFIDPATLLNGPGEPLASAALPRFRALAQRLRGELDEIELAPAPNAENTAKPDEPGDDDDSDL
jgi:murein DD-endopeptidase MepM/ murein hydrolase activator NlpD